MIDYPRWYGTVFEMPPGHYRRAVRPDGSHGATIRCHACHKRFSLADGHKIAPNGHVTPSVVCPHSGCSQNDPGHVAIRLLTSASA